MSTASEAPLANRLRGEAQRRLAESLGAVRVVIDLFQRARAHPTLSARARRILAAQLAATLLLFLLALPTVLRGASYAWQHEAPRTVHRDEGTRAVRLGPGETEVHLGFNSDEEGIHFRLGKPGHRRDDETRYVGLDFLRAHAPWLVPAWVGFLALLSTWILIEIGVGAMSRDYTDEVADTLAREVGVEVAPPPRPPRIRLNLKRLWRKLLSEIGAFLVLASALPFFLIAQSLPYVGRYAYTGTFAAWGLYWLLVSTAAKSDRSWKMVDPPRPWFLRLWDRLTALTPRPLRWIPRGYGRLWARLTRSMNGAAAITEAAPMYVAGLLVVRVAAKIPVLSLVLRPLLPIAADLSPAPVREMGPQPPT